MVILKHNGKTDANTELTDNGIKNTSQALELTSNGDLYKLPSTSGNENEVLALGVVPSNLFWKDISCPSPTLTTPFTIGDRGTPNSHPENSIIGYEYLVKNGLYQIGLSVQKTRDNNLAVMYDTTIDRTTTSSGNVADLLGVEFQNLSMEVGSASRGIDDYYQGTLNPPLLDDVFENFDKSVWYFIQSIDDSLIECYEKAEQFGIENQCVFRSTNYSQILSLLASYPSAITCWIAGTDTSKTPASILSDNIRYIEVAPTISGSYLTSCNTANLDWIVYNIKIQKDYNNFITLGATGVLSEDPLYVSNTLTKLTSDPYTSGKWYGGLTAKFFRPNAISSQRLVYDITQPSADLQWIHQGWLSPVPNPSGTYTISFDFNVATSSNNNVFMGFGFGFSTENFNNGNGYFLVYRYVSSNYLQLYRYGPSSFSVLASNSSGTNLNTTKSGTFTTTITPTSITVSVNGNNISNNNTDFRGGYCFLLYDNQAVSWKVEYYNMNLS